MSGPQKTILAAGCIVLGCILLFPPWQQAAEREKDYRKEIGRAFFLTPPKPVAVDCYFEGCITAPPSYFHVLLDRQLLTVDSVPVVLVAVALLWMFRARRDGTHPTLMSAKTRLAFSLVVGLVLPVPTPRLVPVGYMVALVPWALTQGGKALIVAFWAPPIYAVYSAAVFVVVTVLAFLGRLLTAQSR